MSAIASIDWDGKQISKPGMYHGIKLEEYHGADICVGPSISSSGLRRIIHKSPAHFYATWSGNPEYEEPDTEPAHFKFGRAVHHIYLEPNYSKNWITEPDTYEDEKTGEVKPWSNNANACKRWHEKQRERGKSVLKPAESRAILGMAREFRRNPLLDPRNKRVGGLMHGFSERSIFWQDKKTGVWLKSRPDVITNHSADFLDYKTTTSVLWDDLQSDIYEYAYYQQGALVCEAMETVFGVKEPHFSLIFQEKKAPYVTRIVMLKEHQIDDGKRLNRRALDIFAGCLRSNIWPGPGGYRDDAEYIEVNEWQQKRIDWLVEHGV
jgi:hypothetical protein